ncbi:uncharacterized protein AMSG_03733 [Thecamonas trahens ATCC 50062]|uniref:Amino acid transporter transmembrane domain-containing protein n=1 Tax=Thecamonas trahens ATCC 50062 TaxID=461836 RepID=A0A0L0D4Q2_THETB|nr:hypothetical protein AMSG_03733 [Thecamonas trahens ATCC 50062]KNC47299.1 hypothetical protein AMSG_03733 [Thecamonas trahens ATCC 50062]|eukprot:XP_013759640.1 hypothetical protein AMSG_03733 [Thecamonas trahens ATCC 50062]
MALDKAALLTSVNRFGMGEVESVADVSECGESHPLLASDLVDGESTIVESVVVLANTCIGAGVLAVPYALSVTGVALGLALLVAVALLSMFSFYLLAETRRLSGQRSYEDIAAFYFGQAGRRVVQASLVLLLIGATIIYAILMSDSLHPVVSQYAPASPWLSRDWLSVYAVALIYPLTLAQDLRFLRHTSMAALGCLIYLLIALCVRLFQSVSTLRVESGTDPSPDPHIIRLRYAIVSSKFFLALPIIAVAFNGQFNAVRVANELRNPTKSRVLAVSTGAVSVCLVFYILFGLVGIYSFGVATKGDVLLNFRSDDVLVNVGRVALFLVLAFSYPLFFLPLRETIALILAPIVDIRSRGLPARIALTTALNAIALITSMLVPNLPGMLDVVGATCGMGIAFILPGMFGYKANYSRPGKQIACVALAVIGVVCGIISTVVTIATWDEIGSS